MQKVIIYCLHLEDAGILLQKNRSESTREFSHKLLYYVLNQDAHRYDSFTEMEHDLVKGEHGKPVLKTYPELHFNISHSGRYLLIAIASFPVGIDVQEKKDISLTRLAKRIFNEEEYAAFLDSEKQTDYFYRSWVEKESFVKWTGEGISRSLKGLPDCGEIVHLDLAKEYECAVCAEKPFTVEMLHVSRHLI